MDELMSMMNQLADGETAQVAQSVQDMMRGSIAPAVTAVALGLVICFFGLKLIRVLAAITGICIGAAAGAALALAVGQQGDSGPGSGGRGDGLIRLSRGDPQKSRRISLYRSPHSRDTGMGPGTGHASLPPHMSGGGTGTRSDRGPY